MLSPVMLGFVGSLAAGAMTAAGAVPVLFGRAPTAAFRDLSLGFAADGATGGLPLAIGIGLQNAPEGLAVAVALLAEGYSRWRAWSIASLTGAVEPLGGLLGAGVVALSQPLLPWALAFAAGAMLYAISHEIIPETHLRGHQKKATAGLAVGLVVMLFLDVWLG